MPPSSPPHRRPRGRRGRAGLIATGLAALSTFAAVAGVVPSSYSAAAAVCGTANVAQGRPASASSTESAAMPASAAFDGDTGTRWSSAFSDPQWIQVDLGSSQQICRVVLNWETARAETFKIQVSQDGSSWSDATGTVNGVSGTQTVDLTATGRYVRMYGLTRATGYGYSLWEFAVNTTGGGGDLPGGGDLGPNVKVFDPSMSSASIQNTLDTIFRQQESNQFGSQRYALLFKPGTYNGLN
ncbi:MAG: discoidin domain-containing protein, partial [Thermobispora bispora]|nr:discoidin domain-containing protein [Thermobispora bispora]